MEAVADVSDFVRQVAADRDELVGKRHVGFGDGPVVRGSQNIAGEVEFAQDRPTRVVWLPPK